MSHREGGAVLKRKMRKRCEGTFSAGVSDGQLCSLTQGFVLSPLFYATESLPLLPECMAFTLIHMSAFIIEWLRKCTRALAVCCIVIVTYSCCPVRNPPTSHPVLSGLHGTSVTSAWTVGQTLKGVTNYIIALYKIM